MSRIEEIGNQTLWILGHLAFTIIVNLTVLGGYYTFQQYQAMQPYQIDLSQLEPEAKEALASALIEDGFSVPKPQKKG